MGTERYDKGGIIEGPGPGHLPLIINRGCDFVIPKNHPVFDEARRYLDRVNKAYSVPEKDLR